MAHLDIDPALCLSGCLYLYSIRDTMGYVASLLTIIGPTQGPTILPLLSLSLADLSST